MARRLMSRAAASVAGRSLTVVLSAFALPLWAATAGTGAVAVDASAAGSGETWLSGEPPKGVPGHLKDVALGGPMSVRGDGARAQCLGDKDIDGAGVTNTDILCSPAYEDRRTASIYLAGEFGCSEGGTISAIRYYISNPPGVPLSDFTIRMRHTTASTYTTPACFDNAGWTTVYRAATTFASTGWATLTFSTPFVYDGVSNLEVSVSFNNSERAGGGYVWSFWGNNRSLWAASNSAHGDPLNWTCGTGNPTVSRTGFVPRAQFVFAASPQGACCVNNVCVATVPEAECALLGGTWFDGQDCASFVCPPWNDECQAVSPVTLTPGVPVQFTGTNLGATAQCAFWPESEVWHAVTLPPTYPGYIVTAAYCGSANLLGEGGPFQTVSARWAIGCPCTGTTVPGVVVGSTCADGNLEVRWTCLSPGTYYLPVFLDLPPAPTAAGNYVVTVECVGTYCESRAAESGNSTIEAVRFANIDHDTSGVCDTYDDFTALVGEVRRAESYPIEVVLGDCSPAACNPRWCKVFIDWNGDLDFTDPGEQVLSQGASANPCTATLTGSVVVPLDAALGVTRMRVVCLEGGSDLSTVACGVYSYGATEDYSINILPALPRGACCVGTSCYEGMTEGDCISAAGGVYKGDGSGCTPNPCYGACCQPTGACQEGTEAECAAAGGSYQGDATRCGPGNPCPQPGACCYPGNQCIMSSVVAPGDCGPGGTYWGDGTVCTPSPCPPANDVCEEAIVIGSLPFTDMANVYLATHDENVNPTCDASTCGPYAAWGVWYEYTPSVYCDLTVAASGANVIVSVWTGEDCGHLVQVGCYPGGVSFRVSMGVRYWICVSHFSCAAPPEGAVTTTVTCTPVPPPPNDLCTNANVIATVPYEDLGVEYRYATNDTNIDPDCDDAACPGAFRGVWYEYTPATACDATVTVSGDGVALSVWTGPDCEHLTQFRCFRAQSTCRFRLAGGVRYYMCVSRYLCGEPSHAIDFRFDAEPAPPCVPDFSVTAPGEWSSTTAGAGNDCSLAPSPDHLYEVAIPTSGTWVFETCTSTFDTVLFLGTLCCSDDVASNDDLCSGPNEYGSRIRRTLEAGTYYVAVEGYASYSAGSYTLKVYPACQVTCPPDALIEPEPCGADVNGGCHSPIFQCTPIQPGQTWCGTAWAHYGRDSDWYRLELTYPAEVRWTVTSEFPSQNLIVSGECGALTLEASAYGGDCLPVTAARILPPGTYYLFVAVGGWAAGEYVGFVCGDASDYVATLVCIPQTGACCLPEPLRCEVLSEGDCAAAGGLFAGVGVPCVPSDCNENGSPDQCEIAFGSAADCNRNQTPDGCDIASGFSPDCQDDGVPDECQLQRGTRANLIADASFEAGTPNPFWTEYSMQFGTPLCTTAACGSGGGTAYPRTGLWWAWFGGYAGGYEVGYLEQTVTIPAAGQAILKFWLWNGASGPATDCFRVKLDGDTLLTVHAGDPQYAGGYVEVQLDVLTYANGGPHVLRFEAETAGGTVSSFSLDDVTLETSGTPANDCNANGIPDECDIQAAFGGHCQEPTYPPCDTDYNENGIPDHCELCGDLNGDGNVDVLDYWVVLEGFGRCAPDPRFLAAAPIDVNGNNCIDLTDYRAWVLCYKMANGRTFVPPPLTRARALIAPPANPKAATE